jgi:hypothetical protein
MGKATKNTDDGLPILSGGDDQDTGGLPILKKKEDAGAGSPSPSDSSPISKKTAPDASTGGSGPKQVTANFKNQTLTPKDVSEQPLGFTLGPSPEQLAHSINNKTRNIDRWQNSPSNLATSFLVQRKKELDSKIANMDMPNNRMFAARGGRLESFEQQLSSLKNQRDYIDGQIDKTYQFEKQTIVPDLVNQLKGGIIDDDFDPVTHRLKPVAVQWMARKVDAIMNQKGNPSVNARVSGDLDKKERSYPDLTRSVVDQINLIPVQKAQQEFTKEYTKDHPELSAALHANEAMHDYFSNANYDDLNAKTKIWVDKSLIETKDRYYGKNGLFMKNATYVGIQHKYAQLVGDGKMSQEVALKQMQDEIDHHPDLKGIADKFETEKKKIIEGSQKEYENWLIKGFASEHPKYTVYKDGTIGLASMPEEEYKKLIDGYQDGMNEVAKKMGAESNEAWKHIANKKAEIAGPLWGSLAMSTNSVASGLTKMIFNKTGWGGDRLRHFEAEEIASPSAEQSDVAATWNWKGWESLMNPNFYLSGLGKMVPAIGGAAAVTATTEGAGLPEYVGWLANAGLFTAQSSLDTYDKLLSSGLSESDASRLTAQQATDDFLPNFLMMALTSGTLSRAKNIVKPSIGRTIGESLKGVALAQPFFSWQGFNDYSTMLKAQGKTPDIWDYLQSPDFKDNLVNGLLLGGGMSLVHAPFNHLKSVEKWQKMIHESDGEFKNLLSQNYALGQEMAGNGGYLRDALKMHVFNIDKDGLNEAGRRQLADLQNTLLYSVNLDRNIRNGNLDKSKIGDLYQAHNLALADQYDFQSQQASKEGNQSLSDVYKDKAKDYREQAKAAANDKAKYHYLVNSEGQPIFLSDQSFKVLEGEGKIAQWTKDGTIQSVHDSNDPEFAQRYKEFIAAKDESTVQGKDLIDHGADLIEANKDKLGVYYAVAKDNPEAFYKEVADQVSGRNADGSVSDQPAAEKAARDQYGDEIVDLAKSMYPQEDISSLEKQEGGSDAEKIRENQTELPKVGEALGTEVQTDSGGNIQFPEKTGTEAGDKKDEIITSPKTEDHGKTEKTEAQAEGRKGDVLTPQEGAEKPKEPTPSSSKPTSVVDGPPPSEGPRVASESPKEEFTSVRKEKQREIKGAKELFEKQKVIKWSETYTNALANVQAMYPDKPLYDALRSRVNEFATKLDNNILYNPTSEDIASFNVFKHITKQKIGEISGWDSPDDVARALALDEFSSLHNDLFNVVRVNNPGGEAGRAFNLLQSEIAFDPDHGLQIRRMELLGAKAGEKLTPEELAWSAEQWEKEKALMEQQHEAKTAQLQEKFDKELERLHREIKGGKSEKISREKGQKIAQSLRGFADKLEKFGKPDLPEGTQRMGVDLQKNVADAIRWIADKIANGDIRIPDLVHAAIDRFKGKESEEDMRKHIHAGLSEAGIEEDMLKAKTSREEALAKIRNEAQASGATAITKDMAGKNMIRDYVRSYIGLEENKDIIGAVVKDLQSILPNIDESSVRKAYLKEDEFNQPTKKQLENGLRDATRNFDQLSKLEKDIKDLTDKQDLYKRDKGIDKTPYDKDVQDKEKQKKDLMTSLGVKTASPDKFAKASYDARGTSHNERIDDLNKKIAEKIESGNLSEDQKSQLIKLMNQLDASKVKMDPNSKLSQEKALEGAMSVFKGIQSEFTRHSSKDMVKMSDIRSGLQKIIDQFNSDKNQSEEDLKFRRTKERLKAQSEEYKRKINAGEFEDNPPVILTKADAELIKIQSELSAQAQAYDKKKKELERKNRSNWSRLADVARGAEVTVLIGSPFTLMKVAGSALLRPQLEAATKLTAGKAFEHLLPFDTTKAIVERAKLGGESLSLKSIAKGYEAYFRQYSDAQLLDRYTKSNDAYEKADHEYQLAIGEGKTGKELQDLKNKRDSALLNAVGNVVYQYIAGSSVKEAMEALGHRTVKIERMFGQIDSDQWEKGFMSTKGRERFDIAMQNFSYVMNFVGRSHAALKNFSARQSFAAGFMARLEAGVRDGVDVTSPDRLLEMANASYNDFERGKYQQYNWLSNKWNEATRAVEKAFPQLAYLMKADVAIVRVPVNMLHEGIMEYTLGAFRGSWDAWRAYNEAKGLVIQDGFTEADQKEFKAAMGEQLKKIDPDKAATILRCFRKGGFGLGLYALALLGHAAFGGFAHKGQTAEDKKKKKMEDEFGAPIIKTGQIKIGNWEMPEAAAKIVEHTPAFQPMLFGLGLNQVYENNIKSGKSTLESVKNDAEAHILHIVNSIPQMELIDYLGMNAVDKLNVKKRLGEWQDVDQDGQPIKRQALGFSDYFKYQTFGTWFGWTPFVGDKNEILSENYYKMANRMMKDYEDQISEIEYNPEYSKEEKAQMRQELIDKSKEELKDIYRQNKENPQ